MADYLCGDLPGPLLVNDHRGHDAVDDLRWKLNGPYSWTGVRYACDNQGHRRTGGVDHVLIVRLGALLTYASDRDRAAALSSSRIQRNGTIFRSNERGVFTLGDHECRLQYVVSGTDVLRHVNRLSGNVVAHDYLGVERRGHQNEGANGTSLAQLEAEYALSSPAYKIAHFVRSAYTTQTNLGLATFRIVHLASDLGGASEWTRSTGDAQAIVREHRGSIVLFRRTRCGIPYELQRTTNGHLGVFVGTFGIQTVSYHAVFVGGGCRFLWLGWVVCRALRDGVILS